MDLISIDQYQRRFDNITQKFRSFEQDVRLAVETYLPNYFRVGHFLPGFFPHIRGVPLDKAGSIAQTFLTLYAKHFDTPLGIENS